MSTVDEQQRGRIQDDLKGFIKGDVLFDEVSRGLYSTDASIFQIQPLGVVAPRDEEDVEALVRYAAERQVALIPRGAGTGVAGESLGAGIILDLSRHLRQIVAVGSDSVRVQPGVTCRALNAQLEQQGRRFAPDPASGNVCTVGGMIANNASGSRVLRHGYTRDHVISLRAVLDNGDAVEAGQQPINTGLESASGHWQDIINTVSLLLEQNSDAIRTCRPRTPFNRCGYLLHDVHSGSSLDMPKLLVGSEGTLALFTEATLRTTPLPGGRSVVLLGFASLDKALQAAQRALTTDPVACELMDRRLLSLARGSDAAAVAGLVPTAVEAVLLVEYERASLRAARRSAEELAQSESLALHSMPASTPEDLQRLWQLRDVALPSLYGLKGGAQPLPFVEDVGVPPEQLPEYMRRVQEILQEFETTASFLVHAATGQVHTRPFLDLTRPEDVSKLNSIAEAVHTLALDLHGTISTQHGTGLARTPWVARQYAALYPVFRQIKAAFDPRGIFNPGKIVDPAPNMAAWPLRVAAAASAEPKQWRLRWDAGEVRKESEHCNGCGHCRTETPGQRMCPVFHATHDEAATPRAKANLLRNLLRAGGDGRQLSSDEVRTVADLCVNCKMCAHECPARVNVPKLMLEAKAHNVAEYGLDRTEWFLSRADDFSRWGSALALIANGLVSIRPGRWLLEKVFGLSRQRRVPRFAFQHFLRVARRRGWTRKPHSGRPRLAYFADTFATYHDPQIGEAVVSVLQHQGYDVYVPPEQGGSGAAPLAHGDIDTAREVALRNLRALSDLAREGYTIVCSEPTAALMIRQDYLDLLDDADARYLAAHTVEFTHFLGDLHRQGKLRTDFRSLPMSVGHHVPCHIKALGHPPAAPALLALIPELRVHTIDTSCSGMAGTFGLSAANFATSLEAGRPMLTELARPRILFGSTECGSCRMQMEQGAGKRTLHPAQYLALAYGLVPEIARRLLGSKRDTP
jgi:FAD/FMN-containing dehydrogenase/Fe-S oxidoreductase